MCEVINRDLLALFGNSLACVHRHVLALFGNSLGREHRLRLDNECIFTSSTLTRTRIRARHHNPLILLLTSVAVCLLTSVAGVCIQSDFGRLNIDSHYTYVRHRHESPTSDLIPIVRLSPGILLTLVTISLLTSVAGVDTRSDFGRSSIIPFHIPLGKLLSARLVCHSLLGLSGPPFAQPRQGFIFG